MNQDKQIKQAIQHKNLVFFVGSGLSIRFNLPSWNQLVRDLIVEIEDASLNPFIDLLDNGHMTSIEILEKLRKHHHEVRLYISNKFSINDDEDFSLHSKIFQLSSKIITTNYDNAFEKASKGDLIPTVNTSAFNISNLNKYEEEKYLFKLHGSFAEPDHCIVFQEDYENLYGNPHPAIEKLKSIFSEKTIIFIGFSFNDPQINLIFNSLDEIFENNNKHYVITTEPNSFKEYKFIEPIKINEFNEIDSLIDNWLSYKNENLNTDLPEATPQIVKRDIKVAILSPAGLDFDLKSRSEIEKAIRCFQSLDITIHQGVLNLRTLQMVDDYDLVILVTNTFKSKLYIEGHSLKNEIIQVDEAIENIPNDKVPIIIITNGEIKTSSDREVVLVSSLKPKIVTRFIFKTLRRGELNYSEKDQKIITSFNLLTWTVLCEKGDANKTSIYGNDKDLSFGKATLKSVIGRIEEQSNLALKIVSLSKSHKFLNVKASGGVGKTTLIKKISYELYNRGYFKDGVYFLSCESVRSYDEFEEVVTLGFDVVNIINFKEHLLNNYNKTKIDSLIVLDNFETISNSLSDEDFQKAIDLLGFVTDYSSIVITSRDKISISNDLEEVFSLTPMMTEDALLLFQEFYGAVEDKKEVRILREEILEDLLNNNPLAIKLVTTSRPSFRHISELKEQLEGYFFESINEDYSSVFKNDADLNIERKKSIYQSINYSFMTLNEGQKLSFELLSLFPDGISLTNFKKCFSERKLNNLRISDRELRALRDKSLVEDDNGILRLQPIIRRFADYQFSKISHKLKADFCIDAYQFNAFLLKLIDTFQKEKTYSAALNIFVHFKNNFLKVLDYLPNIVIEEEGIVPKKEYLLNYVMGLEEYISNLKQIKPFLKYMDSLIPFFKEVPFAEEVLKVIKITKVYYYQEFDYSYIELSEKYSVEEMRGRKFDEKSLAEKHYKSVISNVHGMEGHTVDLLQSWVEAEHLSLENKNAFFFYLGFPNLFITSQENFYSLEYKLMFNQLEVPDLEMYIESLHSDEQLELMQCTYTLAKVKEIDLKKVSKLVVTNPYTRGIKNLIYAFYSQDQEKKNEYFQIALENLFHIKYYYLIGIYHYCFFLKETNNPKYFQLLEDGLAQCINFKYQYLNHLFINLKEGLNNPYIFSFKYYEMNGLEDYMRKFFSYLKEEDSSLKAESFEEVFFA